MSQGPSFKRQASSLTGPWIHDIVGLINKQKGHMLKKNNFVVTLKTEKEILDYFKSHTPEEERLLWLGFFIAHNHIAHRLEEIDAKKN